MRIIGGTARGLKLADVGAGDAAAHLRPTSDRVREAIFNLLINGGYGNPVAGARVLDLFAGTGALGLEALSRGADHASFVDDGAVSLALIRANIALMRAGDRCSVHRLNATALPANPGAAHDLVFLDPPYGRALGEAALRGARVCGEGGTPGLGSATDPRWLAPGALIVWEESTRPTVPATYMLCDQRRYGDTHITILRAPGG